MNIQLLIKTHIQEINMNKIKIFLSKISGIILQCLAFILVTPAIIILWVGGILSDIGDTLRMID